MDDSNRLLLIVIFLFFGFAFYFALAETAFASASKIRIKALADNSNKRAVKALRILEDFDHAVTTILIGTNITHLGIASIVTILVVRRWGPGIVGISTLITTIAVFFLSEMLPKSIAKRYAEPFALATASSLLVFMKVFYPVSYILTSIGRKASKIVGEVEEVSVTEEELNDIIEDMTDDGMLDEEQGELITSALKFGDSTVENILTKREDIESISVHTPPSILIEYLLSHKYSRYPVYEGDTDHIVGTLRMRSYLKAYRQNQAPDLPSMLDPPLFASADTGISELLREMNDKKLSVAIIRDKNEKILGMITVEDAYEALVGSVWGGDAE